MVMRKAFLVIAVAGAMFAIAAVAMAAADLQLSIMC
jgi:hypothetical protein